MKARLGDVCTVVSGSTPKSTVPEYWDGDIKWITSAELSSDTYIINDSARHITALGVAKTGLKSFPAGTVILSSRAPIGKTAIAGCEMFCNQGFKNLICSEKIDSKYLYYFLSGKTDYLNSLGRGATFKEISKAIVENIEIPLPEVEEQKRIAARFERLLRLIQLQKAELEELDKLVKSRFIELFGDPIKNTQHRPTTAFVNVVTMQRGFDLPVQDRKQSGNIPVYGSNGVLDHHNQAKVCNGGVITGRSGTIGKVFYTTGAYWPLNTTLFSVDTHENNIIYLAHLVRMFNLDRFTEGTGVPTLNRNKFHSAPIIDVPIDEQNQFAAFVEQTDKSKYYSSLSFRYCQAAANTYRQEWMTCRTSDF